MFNRIFCMVMAVLWAATAIALNEPVYHTCAAVWLAVLIILLDKDTPRNG
jgi:hypothetical protein